MTKPPRLALVIVAAIGAFAVVLAAYVLGDDISSGNGVRATPVADATGTLRVAVPSTWRDIETEPSRDGSVPRILAAPDASAYRTDRGAPGLEYLFTPGLTPTHIARVLDEYAERSAATCSRGDRETYEDRGYEGAVETYSDCGSSHGDLWVLAVEPPSGGGLAVLSIQGATEQERSAILASFTVTQP